MPSKKTLLITASLVLTGVLSVPYLPEFARAQAQAPLMSPRPNGECVTYSNSSALQMCLHKFADGTRCVATGGGGNSQAGAAGAGVALQCEFK